MRKCVISGRALLTSLGAGVVPVQSALRNKTTALYPSIKYYSEQIGVESVGIVTPELFNQKKYNDFSLREKIAESLSELFKEISPCLTGLSVIDAIYLNIGTSEFRASLDDNGFVCTQDEWLKLILSELENHSVQLVDESCFYLLDNVCASSSVSIGLASEKIKSGVVSNSLIIAMDLVTLPILSGLNTLGALSHIENAALACRPFSETRGGFVRAEALGLILLEDDHSARLRNAVYENEISGFGQSSDAKHITAGCELSSGIKSAILKALSSADLEPENIHLIKAHGTGTKINDLNESRAIKEIFDQTPVISFKGQFGHSAASSGLFETILSETLMSDQMIYPSLNSENSDPELEINVVCSPTKTKMTNIMMNAFGFGGNNAVLILSSCRNE